MFSGCYFYITIVAGIYNGYIIAPQILFYKQNICVIYMYILSYNTFEFVGWIPFSLWCALKFDQKKYVCKKISHMKLLQKLELQSTLLVESDWMWFLYNVLYLPFAHINNFQKNIDFLFVQNTNQIKYYPFWKKI